MLRKRKPKSPVSSSGEELTIKMQLPRLVPVLFAEILSSSFLAKFPSSAELWLFFSLFFLATSRSTIIEVTLLIFFFLMVYFLSSFHLMWFACSSVLYLNPRTGIWRRWDRECLIQGLVCPFECLEASYTPWFVLSTCTVLNRDIQRLSIFYMLRSCNNNGSCFFWNNWMCSFCLL